MSFSEHVDRNINLMNKQIIPLELEDYYNQLLEVINTLEARTTFFSQESGWTFSSMVSLNSIKFLEDNETDSLKNIKWE